MRIVSAAEAFPGLLQALSRVNAPSEALAACLSGPLQAYGVQGAVLSALRHDSLTVIASDGLPGALIDRYREIPINREHPATEALRQLAPVSVPLGQLVAHYPALLIDAALWDDLAAQCGAHAFLIVVPLWLEARVGGALGFVTGSDVLPALDDSGTLLGLGAALGMWLQVHRSVIDDNREAPSAASGEVPLVLTARQREILSLVDQGKSNPVIAAILGFSTATVKAELARILRMLRAPDRFSAVQRAKELGLLTPPETGP